MTTFFADVLDADGRIEEFIDSDHTYEQHTGQMDLQKGGNPG